MQGGDTAGPLLANKVCFALCALTKLNFPNIKKAPIGADSTVSESLRAHRVSKQLSDRHEKLQLKAVLLL
jgi:hypothetical protein